MLQDVFRRVDIIAPETFCINITENYVLWANAQVFHIYSTISDLAISLKSHWMSSIKNDSIFGTSNGHSQKLKMAFSKLIDLSSQRSTRGRNRQKKRDAFMTHQHIIHNVTSETFAIQRYSYLLCNRNDTQFVPWCKWHIDKNVSIRDNCSTRTSTA